MFNSLKKWLVRQLESRILILSLLMIIVFLSVGGYLFYLQIVKGSSYQSDFSTSIKKTITIDGIRGNIYDRNGMLLAYNRLAYKVTITDSGTYETNKQKNKQLNTEIDKLLTLLEKNGDKIQIDFGIEMNKNSHAVHFVSNGSSLLRFKADIFGRKRISDLTYNKKLKKEEKDVNARETYEYLLKEFGIEEKDYKNPYRAFEILLVRYNLYTNSYQKYMSTTIAQDISNRSVAAIKEHKSELPGVEVENSTKRVYKNAEALSGIIGYTGKISNSEYEDYSEADSSYSTSDMVGKAGIEKVMENRLKGKKGSQTVYVNNVGKIQSVIDSSGSTSGNNVYLSIDSKLQTVTYKMIEQELAGILYGSIKNVKSNNDNGKVYTPIYDAYTALITNHVIDIEKMEKAKSDTHQYAVYQLYKKNASDVKTKLIEVLNSKNAIYNNQSEAMQNYLTYIVKSMQTNGIFDANSVDASDSVYKSWKKGTISIQTYLSHAIDKGWIDISALKLDSKYVDTSELYTKLIRYVIRNMEKDKAFKKLIYKYLILEDIIAPRELCIILGEQRIVKKDGLYSRIEAGVLDSYSYIMAKIKSLELTPAMLGLDPCSGSVVITNPNNGSVLACVSYPGYDSNKLSNAADSSYYNNLLQDASLPLYNSATQQTTAPGSTFKMVTSIAGLTENVITPTTKINDEGIFEKAGYSIKSWAYPVTHGKENVESALKESSNFFFSEVGYRLSLVNGAYSEKQGVKMIRKYASQFGLADKTGVEIPESGSKVADELPVSASIGQSNNNYTTIQLNRYVTAIANKGTVYNYTLLDKVTTSSGKLVKSYRSDTDHKMGDVSTLSWNTVTSGMKQVVDAHAQFNGVRSIDLAGKTGTAQQSASRPNHALFVGFAPYNAPKVSIACRIPYGYTSSNACDLVANVMKYYFKLEKSEKLLHGGASSGDANNLVND